MSCNGNNDFRRYLDAGRGSVINWRSDGTVAIDLQVADSSTVSHDASGSVLSSRVVINSTVCDPVLVDTGSGLSAGSNNYATIGTTQATRNTPIPTPPYVTYSNNGAPVINTSSLLMKSMYFDNPSDCRWQRVFWTHHHTMPHVAAFSGFSMWVYVQERLYGTGGSMDGQWNTVDTIHYANGGSSVLHISPPSVSYHASGTVAPGSVFQVDSRLTIALVTGSAVWESGITGRSDGFAVNTLL